MGEERILDTSGYDTEPRVWLGQLNCICPWDIQMDMSSTWYGMRSGLEIHINCLKEFTDVVLEESPTLGCELQVGSCCICHPHWTNGPPKACCHDGARMVRPRPTVQAHLKPFMAKPKVKGGEEHCPQRYTEEKEAWTLRPGHPNKGDQKEKSQEKKTERNIDGNAGNGGIQESPLDWVRLRHQWKISPKNIFSIEKHPCERIILIDFLPHSPQPGPGRKPTTKVHAIDQELNPWFIDVWADALITEKHRPRHGISEFSGINFRERKPEWAQEKRGERL